MPNQPATGDIINYEVAGMHSHQLRRPHSDDFGFWIDIAPSQIHALQLFFRRIILPVHYTT